MRLEKQTLQIKRGAMDLLEKAGQTSKNDPKLAIVQLLLSAAVLGKTVDMPLEEFNQAVILAAEVFGKRSRSQRKEGQ